MFDRQNALFGSPMNLKKKEQICAANDFTPTRKPDHGFLKYSLDKEHQMITCTCSNGSTRRLQKNGSLGPSAIEIKIHIQLHWRLAFCLWCELSRSYRFRRSFFCWLWKEVNCSAAQSHGSELKAHIFPKEINSSSRRYMEIEYTATKDILNKERKTYMKIDLMLLESAFTEIYNIVPENKWGRLLLPLVIQRLNLEYVMACLSTLGGAHSSLGEHSEFHAKLAGRISTKQLAVAAKLDNPLLASHCRLYYAHSLIQTGRYKEACIIIRKEFKFATSRNGQSDPKLVTCCKAAWARVRYLQERQLSQSESRKDE